MKKEISLAEIRKYQEEYKQDSMNQQIEKEIKRKGILEACRESKRDSSVQKEFTIEIPECKIYNQRNSYQCYSYAFLRVIKNDMAVQMNKSPYDLNLSSSFIDFYDKLEKVNTAYNMIIAKEKITLEDIRDIVNDTVAIGGTFHSCVKLVQKYGIVPSEVMPEQNTKYNAHLMIELLQDKIKSDALLLKKIQEKNGDLVVVKENLMKEAYFFLSKVMGNPPTSFSYHGISYTPLEFKNQFLKKDLEEFVTVTSTSVRKFKNSYCYLPLNYLKNDEIIIRMKPEELKQAIIKQLEEGTGVWFSVEVSKTLDSKRGVLCDNRLNFESKLRITPLSQEESIVLGSIGYDHAMCITGVKLNENKEVVSFKVEDSFGETKDTKGYLTMPVSFFDQYVLTVVLNKNICKKGKNKGENDEVS